MLQTDAAETMLQDLARYEYASLPHVTLALLWHTMLRMGAERALDVADYSPDGQHLEIQYRPATDTPIKNKQRGERLLALSGDLCLLLDDWLRDRRPDVTDAHGQRPLLATAHERASKTVIRRYSYQFTRPCAHGSACPHDREPANCDAVKRPGASKCPSSVSPHAIRRGSITHHLNSDVPETAVGDRANASQDVLKRHYDRRTEQEKMEQRRQYLGNI